MENRKKMLAASLVGALAAMGEDAVKPMIVQATDPNPPKPPNRKMRLVRMLREEFRMRGEHGMSDPGFMRPLNNASLPPDVQALIAKTGRGIVSRNSACPCGSGKRIKRCCMQWVAK